MIPSGIEPATSRFVAQHLNHCATAITKYYNIMGPPLYLRSVADRTVVMRRVTILFGSHFSVGWLPYPVLWEMRERLDCETSLVGRWARRPGVPTSVRILSTARPWARSIHDSRSALVHLTFWRRNYFFLTLAHPVYKMWIIQEPKTLELWNKLHFEEEKSESIYHV